MKEGYDIIVVGAGIAGASIAAALGRKLLILETEERPGYHSSGRSAAAFVPNYGPAPIRALTRASRKFHQEAGVLTGRETMLLAPHGQQAEFDTLMREQQGMREISFAEARQKFPRLNEGYAEHVVLDMNTADIDVDLLHQHYLRQARSKGAVLHCGQRVTAIERDAQQWVVHTPNIVFRAKTIINAAGAWGAIVGNLAGAQIIPLQPKRRSMAVLPAPEGDNVMDWPFIGDVGETWYCKPQSGKLLVSPADATPVDPHDAYADDVALAEGIDRFQRATGIDVNRVEHSWGGLRSFVPDGNPVVGYDKEAPDFFWLVGQGGYGIQTSPALSRFAAALVDRKSAPDDILKQGLYVHDLDPGRFK